MKTILGLCLLTITFFGCHKNTSDTAMQTSCDIQKVYENNSKKVTITNGIWGTIAFMEGNCMPMVGPAISTCRTCPVKRTVKIYSYTTRSQATPQTLSGFYDSFSTQLIREFDTDADGFFQVDIPAGLYTIVVVENGKLYTFGLDGQGGLSPVNFTGGKQNLNLTLIYKAVF